MSSAVPFITKRWRLRHRWTMSWSRYMRQRGEALRTRHYGDLYLGDDKMSKTYTTSVPLEWCTDLSNHDFRKNAVNTLHSLDSSPVRELVCLRCGGTIEVKPREALYVPLYRADEMWSKELDEKVHHLL